MRVGGHSSGERWALSANSQLMITHTEETERSRSEDMEQAQCQLRRLFETSRVTSMQVKNTKAQGHPRRRGRYNDPGNVAFKLKARQL